MSYQIEVSSGKIRLKQCLTNEFSKSNFCDKKWTPIQLSCLPSHFLKYFINDCFIFIFYFIHLTNIWFLIDLICNTLTFHTGGHKHVNMRSALITNLEFPHWTAVSQVRGDWIGWRAALCCAVNGNIRPGRLLLSAVREKHWVQISINRNTKEKGARNETENSVVNRTPWWGISISYI